MVVAPEAHAGRVKIIHLSVLLEPDPDDLIECLRFGLRKRFLRLRIGRGHVVSDRLGARLSVAALRFVLGLCRRLV